MPVRTNRVVIIGWDGLRPDMITPEHTPHLHKIAAQGARANRHVAAYPTETRVNAATLSTGCWPGRHGIVGNEFYHPAFGLRPVNTGNFCDLSKLKSNEPILFVPSLAQRLSAVGQGMAVLSAGSPGSALMWDPTQEGPVFNVWVDFGDPRTGEMREILGAAPARQTPNCDANHYIVRALTDILLPRLDIGVCVLWLTEPDHSQHERGLGSPEALQSLRDNDDLVARIIEAVDRRGESDCTDFIIVSDHGFSTIKQANKELAHLIVEDHLFEPGGSSIKVVASYGIYLQPGVEPGAVAERITQQPWCGTILARTPDERVGLLPLASAWGGHLNTRAPDLTVSPAWDAGLNNFGVPGTTAFGSHIANHGSLSPYDLRSVFVASGPSFQENLASDMPCGAADLAPTVLQLLGIPPSGPPMDGRVLSELLVNGKQPPLPIRKIIAGGESFPHRQIIVHQVGSTTYLTGDT